MIADDWQQDLMMGVILPSKHTYVGIPAASRLKAWAICDTTLLQCCLNGHAMLGAGTSLRTSRQTSLRSMLAGGC